MSQSRSMLITFCVFEYNSFQNKGTIYQTHRHSCTYNSILLGVFESAAVEILCTISNQPQGEETMAMTLCQFFLQTKIFYNSQLIVLLPSGYALNFVKFSCCSDCSGSRKLHEILIFWRIEPLNLIQIPIIRSTTETKIIRY